MHQNSLFGILCLTTLIFSGYAHNPSMKIAFSYDAIDAINQNLILPFIPKVIDMALAGQNFSFPSASEPLISFSNFSCLNFTINESATHLLSPFGNNQTLTQIVDVSVTIGNNYESNTIIKTSGYGSFTLTGVNVNLTLGEATNKQGEVGIQIVGTNIDLGQFSITFSNKIFEEIFNGLLDIINKPANAFVSTVLEAIILHYISPQIYSLTTAGIGLTLNDTISYTVDFGNLFYTTIINNEAFGCQSLNLTVTNVKYNETAPYLEPEIMPDFYTDNTNVQVFLSQDTIDKAIWGFLQVDNNLVLSAAVVPASSPIQLNTSSLQLILPNMTKHFGPNLGVYVNVTAATFIDQIYIRDGRLVGFMPLNVDFWVDTESTNYPAQGFNSCIWEQNCQLGVSMQMSAFFAAVVYNVNSSFLGASLMNLIIDNVLIYKGYADGGSFEDNLNNLLGALIPTINAQLAAGIANPLIGKCGIESTIFNIETDYIRLALTLTSNKANPMPCPYLPTLFDYLEYF